MPRPDSESIGGWELRETGPPDAKRTVLLLPGGLCTTAFFADVMAERRLVEARLRLIAATLPGHGGTPPQDDVSVESYARGPAALAGELGADAVVGLGHSLGATVAIEMAATRSFSGPLVLLAPALSRADEVKSFRMLDRLSSVVGHLPYAALLKIIGPATKSMLPPGRYDALVAEFHKNDPRVIRRSLRQYFDYLDRHGSDAPRLCESGVRAWLVPGDQDDVGLRDDERRTLEACPRVTVVSIPDAKHFTPNTHPDRVAELILEAVSAAAQTPDQESASRSSPAG